MCFKKLLKLLFNRLKVVVVVDSVVATEEDLAEVTVVAAAVAVVD